MTAMRVLVYERMRMDKTSLNRHLARDLDRHFEALVLEYQDRLYRFALRLSGNTHDAEEIAQDAFIRAYGALQGYGPERIRALTIRPWLYQITLNVWKNRVRRKQLPRMELVDEIASRGDGPEREAETAVRKEAVTEALAALPARFREAVVLRHIEELSYSEIAAVLDQPVGTVKANVHRGIDALRRSRVLEVWA
jgi:RNA polymerase sigma-70 factor (ECF subfamily)